MNFHTLNQEPLKKIKNMSKEDFTNCIVKNTSSKEDLTNFLEELKQIYYKAYLNMEEE